MENQELAKDYFDRHPQSEECHITADGRVFHQIGMASSYASTRKDNKVTSFTRAEHEAQGQSIANDLEVIEGTGGDQNSDQDKEITLANFDPEHKDAYAQGVTLLEELGIETENRKKDTILAAIAEAKAKQTAQA